LHWPDFDAAALKKALYWYSQRVRRFGRTDEQVTDKPALAPEQAAPALPGLGAGLKIS
jgi:hypothetical protein